MIPWPKPCKDRARELFATGITLRQCAEEINREFGTNYNENCLKAMRNRMGVSRKRPGFTWTPETLELLHKAVADKIGPLAAAKIIGTTREVVAYQCSKLGLKWEKSKKPPKWTDDRDDELRRLRTVEGMTTIEIAEAMGIKRGAVIARLGRMGIKAGDAQKKRPKRKSIKPPSPHKVNMLGKVRGAVAGYASLGAPPTADSLALIDHDFALPVSRRVSIVDLMNDMCRFPLGVPGDAQFAYCGAPGADYADGKPYCTGHTELAYRPAKDRTREDRRIHRMMTRVAA